MRGTLNFFDDKTHYRIYSLIQIIDLFVKDGFRPLRWGIRKDLWRIIFLPLLAIHSKFKYGYVSGGMFWDLFGFAEFVFARKVLIRTENNNLNETKAAAS